MRRLLAITQGMRDGEDVQDVRVIVDSNPALPEHSLGTAGIGPSPGPVLAEMARGLEWAGAGFLVTPSSAAHAFTDHIVAATRLPFISLIDETAASVTRHYPVARRIGLLADDTTVEARLYDRALDALGRKVLIPGDKQQGYLSEILHRVRAGEPDDAFATQAQEAVQSLLDQGAEVLVAGAPEIALLLGSGQIGAPLVDAVSILADRTVAYAWGDSFPLPGGPHTALH